VLNSNYVFYTNNGGNVSRATPTGGTQTSIATNQGNAIVLAIDSTYVYWVTSGISGSFGVARTLQASPGTPTSTLGTTTGTPKAIATDGKYLYFGGGSMTVAGQSGVELGYVPVGGGTPSVLSAGTGGIVPTGGLVAIGGYVIWMDTGANVIRAMVAPL